ncbi:MAG TPA: molecular chaperone HtpG [Candidatus Aphodoplasma excrementigallinarum]|uniref:Chaperone protein HtpG n=1 Tax=Candidatus Aphodoplasma excrementigallinarum TaxID=2840673 RepID=A0A9D1NHA8_9FIRM|nr:molecular chaperone HtpG [Candidatus Aphodoplasma excrementigallinarum]
MATKEFKSESKRLLDMMINSIYTHKEIFLRELISNANDALDKLYYKSLTDENIVFDRDNFYIRLAADKDKRLLTITDTGIGMDKDELEENLGTIAKSGSLAFKNENDLKEDVDIIGQFGVGFYSAFMVADCVSVVSKKFGSDEAYLWQSRGAEGYDILPATMEGHGTQITLSIKPNTEEENYDEFLDQYRLRAIVKKYSDYIKYPIKMLVTKSRLKEGTENEYEEYTEDETLNSMIPIWKKSKSELTDDDYNNFYKDKFYDFENPLKTIHTSTDGIISYTALLYIPSRAPFNYYTKEYEKGLQLYANGVLIMDKCSDLLPDYFGFVRGLVDSSDLSLNISREMLQHDRQLKAIASNIKKKIKNELASMLKSDRETYEKFYKAFGRPLKFGVYDNYGADKDFLKDLLLFYSSKEQKNVTLAEYVSRMAEDQKYIYYATAETIEKADRLPQTELLKDKGYEILYLTEDVDEFALKILGNFDGKEFQSVSSSDLDVGSEQDSKEETETKEENKDLFDFLKETLGDKVTEVKATTRLKSHPVCISSAGELSLEMEKVLNAMPNDQKVKAQRVLEININHPIFEKLKSLYQSDKEMLKKYADVLYNSALLIEGLTVEDPVAFSNNLCDIME